MAGDISYLKRMRTGQHPYKIVTLGNEGDSFDVAVVLLSSDEMLDISEEVESRYRPVVIDGKEEKNPKDGQGSRSMFYNRLLCYYSMRNPKNLDEKIADSADEIGQYLDLEDIKRICETYNELLVNKAPKIEVLTEEELEQLKKYLEVTPLKDISIVSLVHLKYFHQTLLSEQCLMNNGSGSL